MPDITGQYIENNTKKAMCSFENFIYNMQLSPIQLSELGLRSQDSIVFGFTEPIKKYKVQTKHGIHMLNGNDTKSSAIQILGSFPNFVYLNIIPGFTDNWMPLVSIKSITQSEIFESKLKIFSNLLSCVFK